MSCAVFYIPTVADKEVERVDSSLEKVDGIRKMGCRGCAPVPYVNYVNEKGCIFFVRIGKLKCDCSNLTAAIIATIFDNI